MNRSRDKEEMTTDSFGFCEHYGQIWTLWEAVAICLGCVPKTRVTASCGNSMPNFRSWWTALQEADLLYNPVSDALGTPSATWMLGTALGCSVRAACALLATVVSRPPPSLLFCCFHFHSSKTIWEAEAQWVECLPSTKPWDWPQGMCPTSVIPALRKWRQEGQKLKVILSYRMNSRLTWAT